jgi:hypothetical protein
MSDVRYIVDIDVRVLDKDLERHQGRIAHHTAGVGRLEQAFVAARSAASAFSRTVGTMTAPFDWAARKALELGRFAGAATMGGGIAAMAYGVTKLNGELESTKIGLGSIFSANGIARDLPAGMKLASDTIRDMREDAKKLPGEFSDLLEIFRTGAIPAFRAGASPEQFRKLSSQAMAAAKVSSVPIDQAAREFAMLLEGRSGAHNVFGMRLLGLSGDKAETFNKLDPNKRLETLSRELGKFSASIDVFGGSFEGLSSTFIDNVKEFARLATEPLFGRVKDWLKDTNGWLESNGDRMKTWANNAGTHLAKAFDWARKKLEEWGPVLKNFAETGWERIRETFQQMSPHIDAAAESLKKFLQDPQAIDKLITLGKTYLALKVAQSATGSAFSVGGSLLQGAGALAQLGVFGGGAAGTAAAGATTGAAGAAGAGVLASLSAAAVPAAAALAAVGFVSLAVYQGMQLHKEWTHDIADDYRLMHDTARRTIGAYDRMSEDWASVTARAAVDIDQLRKAGNDTAAAVYELELASYQAAAAMKGMVRERWESRDKGIVENSAQLGMLGAQQTAKDFLRGHGEFAKTKQAKHKGGGGGTHIQKVEIVVTSNQDPSRIARAVAGELEKMQRNRRSSPYSRNFAASGPTSTDG